MLGPSRFIPVHIPTAKLATLVVRKTKLLRRVHRITAVGCAMIAVSIFTLLPLSKLRLWQHRVGWIRRT